MTNTIKNFTKFSEIFDLIWFIISIVNVCQLKTVAIYIYF